MLRQSRVSLVLVLLVLFSGCRRIASSANGQSQEKDVTPAPPPEPQLVPQLVFDGPPRAQVTAGAIWQAFDVVAEGNTHALQVKLSGEPEGILGTLERPLKPHSVARFDDVHADTAGTFILNAMCAAGDCTPTAAARVQVLPAAPSALIFSVQPDTVVAGEPMTPEVALFARDAYGNDVVSGLDAIQIALPEEDLPDVGVRLQDGLAVAEPIVLTSTAKGAVLVARLDQLSAESTPFDIVAAAPSKLVLTTQLPQAVSPTSSVAVGVQLQDRFDNHVDDALPVRIFVNGVNGPLCAQQYLRELGVDGAAAFELPVCAQSGVSRLSFFIDAVSPLPLLEVEITVAAGPAAAFQLVGVPATASAGACFSFKITASDAWGNPVPAPSLHLTSSDPRAIVPLDLGAGKSEVCLYTPGTQLVTLQNGSGEVVASSRVVVGTASLAVLRLLDVPATTIAGECFDARAAGEDAFGNPVELPTMTWWTSDLAALISLDGPTATARVCLYTAGNQVIAVSAAKLSARANAMVAAAPRKATADIFADSARGDDSAGDGSADSPFRTLSRALEVATAGNVVSLAPGVYPGCHVLRESGLTIRGSGGRTIVDCATTASAFDVVGKEDVTISDLTVRARESGIHAVSSDLTLLDLAVELHTSKNPVGVLVESSNGLVIDGLTIAAVRGKRGIPKSLWDGSTRGDVRALALRDVTECRIDNLQVQDLKGYAAQIPVYGNGAGEVGGNAVAVSLKGVSSCRVSHALIARIQGGDGGGGWGNVSCGPGGKAIGLELDATTRDVSLEFLTLDRIYGGISGNLGWNSLNNCSGSRGAAESVGVAAEPPQWGQAFGVSVRHTSVSSVGHHAFQGRVITVSYSNAYQTDGMQVGTADHMRAVDPLFVSKTDYHLQPASPLVDAGADITSCSLEPKNNGCAYNIGFDGDTIAAAARPDAAHCPCAP